LSDRRICVEPLASHRRSGKAAGKELAVSYQLSAVSEELSDPNRSTEIGMLLADS
jgi:hypothetical protein